MRNIKNNTGGFGLVAIILVIAVTAAIGLAGWLVMQKQNTKPNGQTSTQTQKQLPSSVEDPVVKAVGVIKAYKLPQGWKTLACSADYVDLLVPGQTSQTCDDVPLSDPSVATSPDLAGIGVGYKDINSFDAHGCAHTIQLREERKNEQYPSYEYACQDVVIDGVKGIRETGTHTTQSAVSNGIPSVRINYTFAAGAGKALQTSYMHYPQSAYPDLTQNFDNFVNSIKFNPIQP